MKAHDRKPVTPELIDRIRTMTGDHTREVIARALGLTEKQVRYAQKKSGFRLLRQRQRTICCQCNDRSKIVQSGQILCVRCKAHAYVALRAKANLSTAS